MPAYWLRHGVYFCIPCRYQRDKASRARYGASAKGRACAARYRRTAAAKRASHRHMAKRVLVGNRYYGTAQTPAQAEALKAHVRRRLDAFKEAQCRSRATLEK